MLKNGQAYFKNLAMQSPQDFKSMFNHFPTLKVQSCNLYNNKYMIVSTQITNTEIFALIAVLVCELLRGKILFINRKDNRNW